MGRKQVTKCALPPQQTRSDWYVSKKHGASRDLMTIHAEALRRIHAQCVCLELGSLQTKPSDLSARSVQHYWSKGCPSPADVAPFPFCSSQKARHNKRLQLRIYPPWWARVLSKNCSFRLNWHLCWYFRPRKARHCCKSLQISWHWP